MRMIKSRRLLMAAMGACALFGGATSATAAVFRAVLTGDNVRPAGDPDGWGRLRVRVDSLDGRATDNSGWHSGARCDNAGVQHHVVLLRFSGQVHDQQIAFGFLICSVRMYRR